MKFKSKAENLSRLKLKSGLIPKLYFFKVNDYKKNKLKYISIIQKKFKKKIAVRSSSGNEDSKNQSLAGYFQSILNINPKKNESLELSIQKVINSFKKKPSKKDQILIQEMVPNPILSGVATTIDKDNGSPYYCINYSFGDDTSIVTSGKKGSETFIYFKYSLKKPKEIFLKKIISLLKELEEKFKSNYLDVEFIIDKNLNANLVQIRPLIFKNKKRVDKFDFYKSLERLEKKIKKLQNKHHDLLGNTTVFGVMPDWNPAEIIGYKPKPLALSLYQELITDHIWSEHRKNYGYRDVGSNHLMANFFGTPYIDVRVDFNSWLPNSLDTTLASKLINYYINKFKNNKKFHDKVEFEILFTCYTPSSEKKIKSELNKNFSIKEINKIIRSLKQINVYSFSRFSDDEKKIEILKKKQSQIIKSKMYYIDKIYWLIEDCKKYGTLPFAGLARNAFIATDILKSLVKEKIISQDKVFAMINQVNSITTEIYKDSKKLNKSDFLKIYGHLRPNTYEITSENYKQAYKKYFSDIKKNYKEIKKKNRIKFSKFEQTKINSFLKKSGSNYDFNGFISYIKKSISLREYSKFIFSKSINLIFEYLNIFGRRLNLNKQDLSFMNINSITSLYYNLSNNNLRNSFKKEIIINKKDYNLNLNLKLPETIIKPIDVYFYKENENKINFIGNKNINSSIINLNKTSIKKNFLQNKIVCIDSADPGYDFIFLNNINGLITKYGGVNSHMSIRCTELNIPAAIGVGEKKFNEIIGSKKINLDCLTKKIQIIS